MWELFYLVNVACVIVSWRVATKCFDDGDTGCGYFNIFASALNASIVLNRFI